jgi:hypothetical protein
MQFEASVRPYHIPLVTVPRMRMRLPAFPPFPTSLPKTLSAQTRAKKGPTSTHSKIINHYLSMYTQLVESPVFL